jgi:hypothetical protein
MPLQITFDSCIGLLSLDENEWKTMIYSFFNKLQSKPLGKLLLDKLNYFLSNGYNLEIISNDNSRINFPKMEMKSQNSVSILIPNTEYFTTVDCLKIDINNNNSDLLEIYNCNEINNILDDNFINTFAVQDNQSFFIMFCHELIHTIRYFNGIYINTEEEEYATIYGLTHKSLFLEGKLITENTIRKEWGRLPRISHNNIDVYVQGVRGQEKNKNFTKDSFMNW